MLHERELGGEDVTEDGENAEALADLRAVAHGEMTLAEAGLGDLSTQAGVTEDRTWPAEAERRMPTS